MDRQTAKQVQHDLSDAIAETLKRHGLEQTGCRATYSEGTLDVKFSLLEAAPEGAAFNPNSKEAQAFGQYEFSHGIPADRLGTTFTSRGKEYRIIGYKPRSQKRPVLCCEAGNPQAQTVWAESSVRVALGLPMNHNQFGTLTEVEGS
jgi:hypothetical protein